MTLFIEKCYPFLIALVISTLSFIFGEIFCFDYNNFYSTSLSIFSILIGFLLTVSTIINTLDNEAINFIKKSDKYDLFINYLKKSIYTSLNSLIIVVFYIFVKDSFVEINTWTNTFLVFYLTSSLLNCYRFIKIFIKIIVR
jgi:putative Mn2+ efflux pump MntP